MRDKIQFMRPDGAGTDERLTPIERARRPKPSGSLEADIFKIALIFAILSLLVWGTVFLSQRAHLPDLSANNPSLQEQQ